MRAAKKYWKEVGVTQEESSGSTLIPDKALQHGQGLVRNAGFSVGIEMPQSSSESRFGPEPFRTRPMVRSKVRRQEGIIEPI